MNPFAGEVSLCVDGQSYNCKLTLGALAQLETQLGDDSLMQLVARFEAQQFSARDIFHVLVAGLWGAGWTGKMADLLTCDIEGGPIVAAQKAAQLLALAFAPPEGA